MSYRQYTQDAQTKLFESVGAFFAFSNNQFDEQKQDGVKYAAVGAGLICPKDNVDALISGLDNIGSLAVEADVAENGVKKIIWRELANHEAQITMCIDDTAAALSVYPQITTEDIAAEFPAYMQHCRDNDYF